VYGIDCSFDSKGNSDTKEAKLLKEYFEKTGEDLTEIAEDENIGFETRYSAAGDYTPCFFGISLGDFDEYTRVSIEEYSGKPRFVIEETGGRRTIPIQPSAKDIKEYEEMLKELPDEIRGLFAKPKVFIFWSSS
jgi:peptide subunit release factor RF-3